MTQGFHVSIKFRRLFKKHWFPSRVRSGDQATNGCILFRGHVFYHISSSLTSNSDCQNKNVMRQEETMVVIFRFNIEIHLMTLLIIREKLLIAWWIKLTQMVWDSDVIKALSAWVVGQFYLRNNQMVSIYSCTERSKIPVVVNLAILLGERKLLLKFNCTISQHPPQGSTARQEQWKTALQTKQI